MNEMREVKPTIGLIVPPASGEVPPDAAEIYPNVEFTAIGLGLKEMSVTGYDSVIDQVVGASLQLVARGAQAISLMGTSVSFYRGSEFNTTLIDAIEGATNLPATTMSTGAIQALRWLNVSRPAVGTAYTREVNERLERFLSENSVEAASIESLGIAGIDEVHAVSSDEVYELGLRAWKAATDADGIFISCGGLETSEAVIQLEQELSVPVVASPLAGLWASVRLAQVATPAAHRGRLFTQLSASDAHA